MTIKRTPLFGAIGAIAILTLSLTTAHYKKECGKLKEANNALNITITEQASMITNLEVEKNSLTNIISELTEEKKNLENKSAQQAAKPSTTTPNKNDFKSYMSYKAITNKKSPQWQLQKQAKTDKNGIRCIDEKPLIAVGTGWGLYVGDTALVVCDNGNSFQVVIGDIKSDQHTTTDNKTTLANNCRCEFIVDVKKLNKDVKKLGNAAILKEYSGYVVDIQKQ